MARARVRVVVHPGQMLKIQVRINLGRGDIAVSQQFLHRAQVAAGLQQMAGKGVAQHVRMDLASQAPVAGEFAQPLLHAARADARAAAAEKQGLFRFRTRGGGSPAQVGRDSAKRRCAYGNTAGLAPLARHRDEALAMIDVLDIGGAQLGETQTRRIQQLGHGQIALHQGIARGRREVGAHLIRFEHAG